MQKLLLMIINHKIPPPLKHCSGLYIMEQNALKYCHRFFHHRNSIFCSTPKFPSKIPLQEPFQILPNLWLQSMTPIHTIHSAFRFFSCLCIGIQLIYKIIFPFLKNCNCFKIKVDKWVDLHVCNVYFHDTY